MIARMLTFAAVVGAAGCYATHPIRVNELLNVNGAAVTSNGPPLTFYNTFGPGTSMTIDPQQYTKLRFHQPDGTAFPARGSTFV